MKIIRTKHPTHLYYSAVWDIMSIYNVHIDDEFFIGDIPQGTSFTAINSINQELVVRFNLNGIDYTMPLCDFDLAHFDEKDVFAVLLLGDFFDG